LTKAARDPARDEMFIAAVRSEFPNVVSRQILPPDAPLAAAHLALTSESSQVTVSAVQADFQVQFYGEYVSDVNRGLDYLGRKLITIRQALEECGAGVFSVGLVAVFHFKDLDVEGGPTAHVIHTLTKLDVDPEVVQDAVVRMAVKVRDTYFVNLRVANYEIKQWERPIMPGQQAIRVRPWEGTTQEEGLELTVDINNRLEAITQGADPEVTDEGINAVVGMLKDVATTTGRQFVESGELSVESLAAGSNAEGAK